MGLIIRSSDIHAAGCYTTSPYRKGTKVVEYTGPRITKRQGDRIYDDRSAKKRVTGPIAFAIDGKNETAWGIDVGPGRRNQPRKAVFTADKPIAFPRGTILTFHLAQNHGGWNSDDNQNHNLGRFRLSVTNDPKLIRRSGWISCPTWPT